MIQKQLARRRPGQSDLSTPVRRTCFRSPLVGCPRLPSAANALLLAVNCSATSTTRLPFSRASRMASPSVHPSASLSATRTSDRTTTPRPTSTRGRRTPTGPTWPSTESRPAVVADGRPLARLSVCLVELAVSLPPASTNLCSPYGCSCLSRPQAVSLPVPSPRST